jgi:hypothetical protein
MTEEDKQEVIELIKTTVSHATLEKWQLLAPDAVGNLMKTLATTTKLNKQLYEKYPEFKKHEQAVASVIEKFEGENTLMPYEEIYEKIPPLVKERIKTVEGLDTLEAKRPSLDLHGKI